MLTIGELFSGIGGASLAVHAVIPNAVTLWQSDLVNERIRARHFPEAQQLVGDVRTLDPSRLPRVDLLTAGFPCQDLSLAGKRTGLDGARSGLYSEVLRFTGAIRPERVLIENVPALLTYMPRLCADFRALGYGLTWTVCEALDAGLPHVRRRVFVLAEQGGRERGEVQVNRSAAWTDATAIPWSTATTRDHKDTGPKVDYANIASRSNLVGQVALAAGWSPENRNVCGINPDWVEALMGYPIGWTRPEGPALPYTFPPIVRGRYPAEWDRSVPWPGFDWEPCRTIPNGVKVPDRVARLAGLGNSWVPAQGALALRALLGEGRQLSLL